MANAIFRVPKAVNEPVKSYGPGSPERAELKAALKDLKNQVVDIPMVIGGKEVRTGNKLAIHPPHELSHTPQSSSSFFDEDVTYYASPDARVLRTFSQSTYHLPPTPKFPILAALLFNQILHHGECYFSCAEGRE